MEQVVVRSKDNSNNKTRMDESAVITEQSSSDHDLDWQLMMDTLNALLLQDSDVSETGDLKATYLQTVRNVLQQHGPWTLMSLSIDDSEENNNTLPNWYLACLECVVSDQHLSSSEWQGILFSSTLAILQSISNARASSSSITAQRQLLSLLLDQHKLQLWSFIMANVGSSSLSSLSENMEIRALAWSTAASLVETYGWDWTMKSVDDDDSHASLGRASSMCIMTRLAAGEWRIQLEQACLLLEEEQQQPLNDNQLVLLWSCGRIVLAALQKLVLVAAAADDDDAEEEQQLAPVIVMASIPPNALLHLRRSLQDVIHATVSFYTIQQNRRFVAIQQESDSRLAESTSRVMAAILTEFSVWEDDLPKGITTDETLKAIRVALEVENESGDGGIRVMEWNPCLSNILASAYEEKGRLDILRTHELIGNSIVLDYFYSFWRDERAREDLELVRWACQAIEEWYAASGEDTAILPLLKKMLSLAKLLLEWICATLAKGMCSSPSPMLQVALSSAVGCYVVLMGDRVPNERDAAFIEEALKVCAIYVSEGIY
jgi:hypothetical protein